MIIRTGPIWALGLLTATSLLASEQGDTESWLQDSDDFLAADSFEVVIEATQTPSLLSTLGFAIEEQLGWSNNQAALISHQTTASAKWAGSLSPAWFLEWDASAQIQWPAEELMTGQPTAQRSSAQFNSLFVQYSTGPVSAKLGKYSLGWGEVEGAGVLDIINPAPNLTQANPLSADSGQWLASARFYGTGWELSGFYNLAPELVDLSSLGYQPPSSLDTEWGVRLGSQLSSADISLYAGQFIEDLPVRAPVPPTTNTHTYKLIGVAANKAIGNWLLKADLAHKAGLAVYSALMPTSLQTFDRIDLGLGVELNHSNGQQYALTLYGRQWQGLDSALGPWMTHSLPPALLPDSGIEAGGMARFSDSFFNDDLTLSVMATGDLSGEMMMVSGALGYQLSDQWKTDLQLTTARAPSDSAYAAFDGEILAMLSVTWQY